MLHDVIYEIKCTEAEAAAYKAGLFKVMRRIYQGAPNARQVLSRNSCSEAGDGATEAKSSTSASIKSPNSDLEVAKELQGRAHRSRSDSPVIITSGPSTRKKSPVVTLIEDDPVPAAVKSPTPPPKRKHVPHPSTQKPQYKDGDEVASGYCMYSVTFPKPKWSKDQSTRNRETEAFKNGLYDQLIYVVKNEEIHAAFIEFSDGQPSAVVIQDSTVFGLKSAYVQVGLFCTSTALSDKFASRSIVSSTRWWISSELLCPRYEMTLTCFEVV